VKRKEIIIKINDQINDVMMLREKRLQMKWVRCVICDIKVMNSEFRGDNMVVWAKE